MLMHIQTYMRTMLEDERAPSFKRLVNILAGITILSVCATAAESIPRFMGLKSVFVAIEWFVVILFTIEYVMRIWATERRVAYILSPLGIADLASILPSYLGFGNLSFLKTTRIARTLRFVRFVGRTNISYVRQKSADFSEDLSLSPHNMFLVFFSGSVLSYSMFFLLGTETWSSALMTFLGVYPVPVVMTMSDALILIVGRVLSALTLGYAFWQGVEYVTKRSTQK